MNGWIKTKTAAAKAYAVSRKTMIKYCDEGLILTAQIGGTVYVEPPQARFERMQAV